MDPVQYMLHLIEQGKHHEDAYAHASARFGLSKAQLEQLLLDARLQAKSLIVAIDSSGLL